MYCKKCGKELEPEALFCGNCGERISGDSTESMKPFNENSLKSKKKSRCLAVSICCLTLAIVLLFCFFIFNQKNKYDENTPTGAVNVFLKAIKEQDMETIDRVYLGESAELSIDNTGSLFYLEVLGYSDTYRDTIDDTALKFSYKVSDVETLENDSAVNVQVSYVGTGWILVESMHEIHEKYVTGKSEDDIMDEDLFIDLSIERFAEKMKTEDLECDDVVTIGVKKVNDSWKVKEIYGYDGDDPDKSILNCITGGFYSAIYQSFDEFSDVIY